MKARHLQLTQARELFAETLGVNEIVCVEPLQLESARSVYRLGLREPCKAVIAKRCPQEDAERELLMYREYLPSAGIDGPCGYGVIPEDGGTTGWLLMEEIVGESYDPGCSEHRRIAASWLATLHTQFYDCDPAPGLRAGAALRYRPSLEKCLEVLPRLLSGPCAAGTAHQLTLRMLDFCQRLAQQWHSIDSFCINMPQTVVHGDFKEDNMKVIRDGDSVRLVVFDWGQAGWGAPALDAAKFLGYSVAPEFDSYLGEVKNHWPEIDRASWLRLAYIGEVFRWLDTVRWHVKDFAYGRTERALSRMSVYAGWMDEIMAARPWANSGSIFDNGWVPPKKHWF